MIYESNELILSNKNWLPYKMAKNSVNEKSVLGDTLVNSVPLLKTLQIVDLLKILANVTLKTEFLHKM